jgi:hypothetical protein
MRFALISDVHVGPLAYFGGKRRKLMHHRASAHELFRHTSPHGRALTAVGLKVTYDNEGLTGRRLFVGRRPHEGSAKTPPNHPLQQPRHTAAAPLHSVR